MIVVVIVTAFLALACEENKNKNGWKNRKSEKLSV